MLDGQLRLRSFMFLPAHNTKFLDKALVSGADAIILDLEDGVPPDKRKEARENIVSYAKQGLLDRRRNIFIRINPIDTYDFISDIEELTLGCVDGFMPSKVDTAKDIEFLDGLLDFQERKKGYPSGKYKLAPLIETTKALENISGIASASSRLAALCLGGEDYLNDLGSVFTYQESALAYPRALMVNAARANGLLPIDTPYLDIKDTEGFREHCLAAYKNGFAGGLILSPRQIDAANEAFTPDEEKAALSRRVIEAVRYASEEGISGVAMLDGTMVGPPMRKRAETVLKQIGEVR
ncbi:MAG: CoA ester lyase [Clostridia bacterium]|nr:CoA ester lyase [Clostridia bacterium]